MALMIRDRLLRGCSYGKNDPNRGGGGRGGRRGGGCIFSTRFLHNPNFHHQQKLYHMS